ncbi:MAG: alpha/beta fold hydrolase [Deltaproteobacteria bacterium]|nr:alpha/beta fold hydrolase [Deltaproteobacteria bacterium]
MSTRAKTIVVVAGLFAAALGQFVLRWNRYAGLEVVDHVESVRESDGSSLDVSMQVYARPVGGGRLPGVVFVHGFMASHELYEANYILPLARSGYVVAAIDVRGHGDTGGAMRFPRRFEPEGFKVLEKPEILAAIQALRRRPDVDPARIALVGHSMGGHAVTDAALLGADVGAVVAIAGINGNGDWAKVPNYLFLNCAYDQYISRERSLELAQRFSGGMITEAGQVVGRFEDGSARGLKIFPGCEHIMEVYHPGMSHAVMDWLDRSLGHRSQPPSVPAYVRAFARDWLGSGLTIAGVLAAAGALLWAWLAFLYRELERHFPHTAVRISGGRISEAIQHELGPAEDTGDSGPLYLKLGMRLYLALWLAAPLLSVVLEPVLDHVPLALAGPVLAQFWAAGILFSVLWFLAVDEDNRAHQIECLIRGAGLRYLAAGVLFAAAVCGALALGLTGSILDYWPTARKWGYSALMAGLLLPPLFVCQFSLKLAARRSARTEKDRLFRELVLHGTVPFALAAGMALFRYRMMMPLEWLSAATAWWMGFLPFMMFRRDDETPARVLSWALIAGFALANLLPVRMWE